MDYRKEPPSYDTFDGELEVKGGPDPRGAGRKGFTIDEAIEHIGFGWPQVRIGLMAGFAWVADGMEIMVLSILGPVLMCEWEISTVEEALMTTVVFIGFLVGSPVFGLWADTYGRKKTLLLSACWVLFYGILSAISPNFEWLLILRCLVGFGIGGGPQAITYYAEFLPVKTRGKLIILIEVLWALGGMFEAVLALLLMQYGWRWWLLASGAPVLFFVIFTLFLPPSPRYELACGRPEVARRVLEGLAKGNGKNLPPGELIPVIIQEKGQAKELLKPQFRVTSALLAFLWFCCAFIYYGLILFTTDLIKVGNTCEATGTLSTPEESLTCGYQCDTLTDSDYIDLIWTSAAELPGLLLTVFLIDLIGRKLSIVLELIVFSISCFLLFICLERVPMLVLLFVCRALAASSFQILYVYTPEVYPLEVRALSVGVGSGFGRIGAIITPYIAEVLLGWSLHAGLSVYAILGLLGAVVAFLLPIETKGRTMDQATLQ